MGYFGSAWKKLLASLEIKNVVIINFLCLLQSNFSKKKNCVYMKWKKKPKHTEIFLTSQEFLNK